jgi:hypothetical protein
MTLKNRIQLNGLLFISLMMVFLWSCNQDNQNNQPADFNSLYQQTAATPQSFTVNANSNTSIVGIQGTIVNIPANSFETAGGTPVSGNVTFYLTEVYDNNQMILNQRPTFSGNQMLISGGVVNLAAYQGSNELVLSNSINILMPTANTTALPSSAMQVFYWTRNDSTSNPTDSTWVTNDTSWVGVDSSWTFDSIVNPGSGWYYSLWVNNLNWINCDQFYGMGALGEIMADAPDGYGYADTRVYMILTSINSCAELYNFGCSPYEFCTGSGFAVPVGYSYAIAAIHYDSGTSTYSSSIVSGLTVAASNNIVTLNFSATTIAQFEADVMAL